MPFLLVSPLLLPALAQTPERPTLPFRSLAGEDGVHVLYTNPALMNFDRDAGYGAYYDTTTLDNTGLSSLTLATTGSGLGAGLGYRQVGSAGWWTVSSGASIRLAESLSFGSSLNWQLPDGGNNNFVSWDIGLGWRPASFLGFGASVQNLGNPSPALGVYTRYGGGLAVRPFGDAVTLGVDYLFSTPPSAAIDQRLSTSLRMKPGRGVWIRLFGEQGFGPTADTVLGGALELHFADLGVGVHTHTALSDPAGLGAGGWIQTVPGEDQLFLPGKAIATFTIEGDYPYQPMSDGMDAGSESYLTLLRRINASATDKKVRGLLFELDAMPFNFAQIEEIRALIAKARANGKPVVAYLGGEASNGAYLLAAACDKVYLHPAGQLDLVGLSVEQQFFRGALDLVGVTAQYAKRGEFKSAPEQWTNEQSSDPAREEMNALLDDLYDTLVTGIATGRGKTVEDVRALIDKGPFTGDESVKNGFVDGLAYKDELDEKLNSVFPDGWDTDGDYAVAPDQSGWEPQRAIAVVVVDGVISSGTSSPGGLLSGHATGSDTVVQELNQARRTRAVKAVVLRVDSPGGSALASDEIWRAVERVKMSGKPVIVSMGGYAASGGYYVAAGADAIYALPSTITGSIGVYGGKISASGLFDKLNVGTESYTRGRNAGMYTTSRPFDDVEFAALDHMIADTYRQFKEKVEKGRSLSPERVEEVARGRVWSGVDAKERGLVDNFGGFMDAVDRARMEADMDINAPYTLITYDPWYGPDQELPARIVHLLTPKVKLDLGIELPDELREFWSLAALRDEHIYAMMPYRMEVQ